MADSNSTTFRLTAEMLTARAGLLEQLGELLAQAFFHDPFYSYIMSRPEQRLAQLRWWMKIFLRNGVKSGEVLLTGTLDSPTGVAIWLGPRKPVPSSFRVARLGLLQAPVQLGLRDFRRMLAVTNEWQRRHRQQQGRHWYLNFLAVHPDHQGRGLGKALIKAMNERAEQEGLYCYLETCSPINVKIYERFGFQVVTEKEWGQGAQAWSSWTMRCR